MSETLATTESTVAAADSQDLATHPGEDLEDYVTFKVEGQLFGIPVLRVQDILKPERIAPVPLAPKEVKGSINLRGRIVTVIDVRIRLGLEPRDSTDQSMGVTVEQDNDLIHPSGRRDRRRHWVVPETLRKEPGNAGPLVAGICQRRFPPR